MRTFVLSLFLGLSLLLCAGAAEIQFYFDSTEGYPGMPQQLVLQVVDSRALDRPTLPEVSGLSYKEAGQSVYKQSSFGSGGNGTRVTTEYRWLVTPNVSGRFVIPSITLEMKDETLRTEPLVLDIKEPGPVEGYHLFLESDRSTVFPGMPVRLTLKWLFSSEVSRPDFTLPFLNRDDLSIQDLPAPSSSSSDIYQFEADGHTLYAVQSAEIYEGKQYASISISWDLYPEKAGVLQLEPVYLAFQRVVKDSYGRKKYAPAVIPSSTLRLTVKDLPSRLTEFPGGILIARDKLEVEASMDQQRVYPGDPVELNLRIKGLVNPGLSNFKGVDGLGHDLFRTESGSLHASVEEDDKVVSQKIRMLRSGMTEFPSLEFPYYNMSAQRVETAHSNAAPLEVLELNDADLNVVKDQPFLKDDDLTEDGAVKLKGNHSSRSFAVPVILYDNRWIVFSLALLCLLLSQLPRLSVRNLRFRRVYKRGEFYEFKKSVSTLATGKGDEYALLALIHDSGMRWLDSIAHSSVLPGGTEESDTDLVVMFRKDMDELEHKLWNPEVSIDEELKERLLKWPGLITGVDRRRRA